MTAGPSAEGNGAGADVSYLSSRIADLLIEEAGESDPAFVGMINAAAVPRKFDAVLLAFVVGTQETDPGFSRPFDLLLSMPFVTQRRDGRLQLHNEIREALLARCEASDPDWLHAANQRVAAFYDEEHERARHLTDQLGLVEDSLRAAVPQRLPTIRNACEDRLIRAVLEAQHHRTVLDPAGTGLDAFARTFQRYEAEHRLGVLRMLLTSFRTDVRHMAAVPGRNTRGLSDWLDYYSARLLLAEGACTAALESARRLLASKELEVKLRLWSLALATDALTTCGRFAEALDAVVEERRARPEPDPDPWNLALVHRREARLHDLLWDPDRQEASLREALSTAQAAQHAVIEIGTLQQLAGVLARNGQLAAAAGHAIRAIHLTRTCPPPVCDPGWSCALQMMTTFGPRDPRLADLFHTEARSLVRGDPVRTLHSEASFAEVLTSARQYQRAHDVLDELADMAGDLRVYQRSRIDIVYANLLDAEGREREAVEHNQRTVGDSRTQLENTWTVAAALTNAATTEMQLGDLLDQADRSAEEARKMWAEMGHARGVTLTRAVHAEVLRRRGRYHEAEAVLAGDPPPTGRPVLAWHMVWADLAVDVGRLDDAAAHLGTIIEEEMRSGQPANVASAAARAIRVNLRAGRLVQSQRDAATLQTAMAELATTWAYVYGPQLDAADQHNARAVRQLSAGSKHPKEALRDAVQNLDEAIKLDPATCWYPLNQAYAYVKLGDRRAGEEAFDQATKIAPAPYQDAINGLAGEFPAWTPAVTG